MLTYNVVPAKLQLESQILHLKFYDLNSVPAELRTFGLVDLSFLLSFILLQKHFRFEVTTNDSQAYIVLLGSS